jgi:hypothetical protein
VFPAAGMPLTSSTIGCCVEAHKLPVAGYLNSTNSNSFIWYLHCFNNHKNQQAEKPIIGKTNSRKNQQLEKSTEVVKPTQHKNKKKGMKTGTLFAVEIQKMCFSEFSHNKNPKIVLVINTHDKNFVFVAGLPL